MPAPDAHSAPAPLITTAPGAKVMPISIDITPEGFLVFPDFSVGSLRKEDLEDLMRDYLTKHYSITFTM
jgi:hypothetical protein